MRCLFLGTARNIASRTAAADAELKDRVSLDDIIEARSARQMVVNDSDGSADSPVVVAERRLKSPAGGRAQSVESAELTPGAAASGENPPISAGTRGRPAQRGRKRSRTNSRAKRNKRSGPASAPPAALMPPAFPGLTPRTPRAKALILRARSPAREPPSAAPTKAGVQSQPRELKFRTVSKDGKAAGPPPKVKAKPPSVPRRRSSKGDKDANSPRGKSGQRPAKGRQASASPKGKGKGKGKGADSPRGKPAHSSPKGRKGSASPKGTSKAKGPREEKGKSSGKFADAEKGKSGDKGKDSGKSGEKGKADDKGKNGDKNSGTKGKQSDGSKGGDKGAGPDAGKNNNAVGADGSGNNSNGWQDWASRGWVDYTKNSPQNQVQGQWQDWGNGNWTGSGWSNWGGSRGNQSSGRDSSKGKSGGYMSFEDTLEQAKQDQAAADRDLYEARRAFEQAQEASRIASMRVNMLRQEKRRR